MVPCVGCLFTDFLIDFPQVIMLYRLIRISVFPSDQIKLAFSCHFVEREKRKDRERHAIFYLLLTNRQLLLIDHPVPLSVCLSVRPLAVFVFKSIFFLLSYHIDLYSFQFLRQLIQKINASHCSDFRFRCLEQWQKLRWQQMDGRTDGRTSIEKVDQNQF